MILLTRLLSHELPENQAGGPLPSGTTRPRGPGSLARFCSSSGRLICCATALPLTAGSIADRELLRRHQALNRERGSGPQLALQATVTACAAGRKPATSRPGGRSLRDNRRPRRLICACTRGPGKVRRRCRCPGSIQDQPVMVSSSLTS